MDVDGKVVLVTGGGGGIGGGIAEAFAEKGARVAVSDINRDYAQAEAQRIGNGVIALQQDVTSPDSWADTKATVETRLGPVDIVCNNAGISLPFKPMEQVSLEEFDRVMAINLRGVFLGCNTFVPEMKARGHGHIVNTSSVNGQIPHQTFAVYSASKFAVSAMSEALRDELAPFGVGVSILYPGLTRSRMSEGQMPDLPEAQQKALAAMMMEPVWLGRAVVRAVESDALHIITHPDHLPAVKARIDALCAAYGEPAQPGYVAGRIPGN
jgi:NAD(P)-dependent dehydrogenase (short-subunit alcohol dehydrogenase family)